MPKQETVTRYQIDDQWDGKDRALESMREVYYYQDEFIFEFTVDEFKAEMEKIGIDVAHVYYSVGFCQSDGACFEGAVDLAKWVKSQKMGNQYRSLIYWADWANTGARIKTLGSGVHHSSISVEADLWQYGEMSDLFYEQLENAQDAFQTWARNKASALYTEMADLALEVSSDKYLIEMARDRGVWFSDNGRIPGSDY